MSRLSRKHKLINNININSRVNIEYISLKHLLCDTEGCITTVGDDIENDLIVWDYGHLTTNGAKYIVDNILSKYFK